MKDVAKSVGKEGLEAVAKEGGKEAMKYETEHGQQQLDDAKAQAQVRPIPIQFITIMETDGIFSLWI